MCTAPHIVGEIRTYGLGVVVRLLICWFVFRHNWIDLNFLELSVCAHSKQSFLVFDLNTHGSRAGELLLLGILLNEKLLLNIFVVCWSVFHRQQ